MSSSPHIRSDRFHLSHNGMGDSDSVISRSFRKTCHKIKSRMIVSNSEKSRIPALPDCLLRRFSLSEINAATANFSCSSLIGEGCFSSVYKGVIDNGSLPVAVKRFFTSHSNKNQPSSGFVDSEFRTEALLLCQLRHPNIIQLIGFCCEHGEEILVYEYMPNGVLDRHLFDPGHNHLSWKQRLQICIEVARGLQYLHTGLKRVLIHRCVNTLTVLLDDKWGAKISSFALSKLGPSTVSSKPLVFKKEREVIVGTWGYIAPEYAFGGDLSTKSDVYTFGVVLLEVLSGRRATTYYGDEEKISLIPWCGKNIENGTVYEITDPLLRGKVSPESLIIFLQVADGCLAWEADERPMMGEVEMTLERALMAEEKLQSWDNNHETTEFYNYAQGATHLSDDSSNLIKYWRGRSQE